MARCACGIGATGLRRGWRTAWQPVDPDRDYTTQFALESLDAASKYQIEVDARAAAGELGGPFAGAFRTAPVNGSVAPVLFTVISCTDYPDRDLPDDGFKIYPAMRQLAPAFFVHTGDILYYDQLAKSVALARWHWQQVYSLPTNLAFHREVPGYFMKDDHDTWCERLLARYAVTLHGRIHFRARAWSVSRTSANGRQDLSHCALGKAPANLDGGGARFPQSEHRHGWTSEEHLGRGTEALVQGNRIRI
jgi:hypothetical protein